MRIRCPHGPDEGVGSGAGGAAPPAKRAKLGPASSRSYNKLRTELKKLDLSTKGKAAELAARLEEHRLKEEGAQECGWEGKVCDLAEHLTSCGYEPLLCPNEGCTQFVPRKDAALHESASCECRLVKCTHCFVLKYARDLPGHEDICPAVLIECPNADCGRIVAREIMATHRGVCKREVVGCPCPGCEERMERSEVDKHLKVSGAVHAQKAWETVTTQTEKIEAQGLTIEKQNAVIAGLLKRADALPYVFTWSTDRKWSSMAESATHTFTETPLNPEPYTLHPTPSIPTPEP
jgi:hypothetical protein